MSDAKQMAELAAEVAEKGSEWKQRAVWAETQVRRLQETVDRKQAAKLLLQKEVAELREEVAKWKELAGLHEEMKGHALRLNGEMSQRLMQAREECAKVVEQTIDEMRLHDNQWARAGLLFAARAVRRGRHLTAKEKLENFRTAMAEVDEDGTLRVRDGSPEGQDPKGLGLQDDSPSDALLQPPDIHPPKTP